MPEIQGLEDLNLINKQPRLIESLMEANMMVAKYYLQVMG